MGIFTADLFDAFRNDEEKFINAARRGKKAEVEEFLKKGININARNKQGSTALLAAIKNKKYNIAEYLITVGANISTPNHYGNTPLISAAYRGNTNLVKTLIEKGADINAQNGDGNTALLLAAQAKKTQTALELINSGADVNILNNNSRNALMRSAWRADKLVAQALIDAGSRLDIVNIDGHTALRVAKTHSNSVRKIIEKTIEDQKNNPPKKLAAIKPATAVKAVPTQAEKAPTETTEVWRKMGSDRISFTGTYPEEGSRLKEIYNFAARERIMTTEDLASGQKTPPAITPFNQIALPAIEKALNKFTEQGGKTDKDFALHGSSMLKGKSPNPKKDI